MTYDDDNEIPYNYHLEEDLLFGYEVYDEDYEEEEDDIYYIEYDNEDY